jgi:hypothetical protein
MFFVTAVFFCCQFYQLTKTNSSIVLNVKAIQLLLRKLYVGKITGLNEWNFIKISALKSSRSEVHAKESIGKYLRWINKNGKRKIASDFQNIIYCQYQLSQFRFNMLKKCRDFKQSDEGRIDVKIRHQNQRIETKFDRVEISQGD